MATFEQALNEALIFAKNSYSENCDLHTIHNGLIHCNQSYVNKQVKISRQLLDRLNEIARQYTLTHKQKDEINCRIYHATQDVITCRAKWLRMYRASRRINHKKIQNEHKRRRLEEQQIQLRRTRNEQNLNERRAAKNRFMEEFRQVFGADNQRADDNANF